jgi:hypothetical protein
MFEIINFIATQHASELAFGLILVMTGYNLFCFRLLERSQAKMLENADENGTRAALGEEKLRKIGRDMTILMVVLATAFYALLSWFHPVIPLIRVLIWAAAVAYNNAASAKNKK